MNELALLIADTDETQSYVFESNKLPEIRGASRQLDRLNHECGDLVKKVVENLPEQLIYADGGGLLALVPVREAQRLAEAIEQRYPLETGVATVTAAWRPLPQHHADLSFGDLVTWGTHWLRRRKQEKAPPPFWETLPHQTRCRSCQRRPAETTYRAQLVDWPICTVCYRKRGYGLQQRAKWEFQADWFEQFEEHLQRTPALQLKYFGTIDPTQVMQPQTVDQIGQTCRGKPGYVAFIYMDGDRVGQLLQTIKKPEQYKKLSDDLRHITHQAVFNALGKYLHPKEVSPSDLQEGYAPSQGEGTLIVHPFEIITIGGDDVLLIVPAHVAVPLAAAVGQAFAAAMNAAGWPGVSMSAGIIMGDDHTPVRMMADLAKQLLREAKKCASQAKVGALDFHILRSADMLDRTVAATREQYPYWLSGRGQSGKALRLLARPYTYDAMQMIWKGLEAMSQTDFATSQMNLLAESLLRGRHDATLFFEYQRKRRGGPAYDALNHILTQIQQPTDKDPLPWQTITHDKLSHQTVLWDLAELYDFFA